VTQTGCSGALTREQSEAALSEAQNIARAELDRRRRRLGTLTHEQEIALEGLLMSTVAKISDFSEKALESFHWFLESGAATNAHEVVVTNGDPG